MSAQLSVFAAGDHFATTDESGQTRLWRVDKRGLVKIVTAAHEPASELLSVNQVASQLGMSPRTIWAWISSGKLASTKMGSVRRVQQAAVDKIMRGES